ncbi:hypothetical protein EON64_17310 [archaeon]|nr:MAG: hypothetical protein EON64_17310 [archaeon]
MSFSLTNMSSTLTAPNTADNNAPTVDFVDSILPLSLLKEDARQELQDILQSIRGRKCLIVDNQLEGLLREVVAEGSKWFKEQNVVHFKELDLDLELLVREVSREMPEHFVYLLHASPAHMQIVSRHVTTLTKLSSRCQFKLFFVPNQSTVCMHLLGRGVWMLRTSLRYVCTVCMYVCISMCLL